MQLFLFLFPLQHVKRPALQNKQVVVLQMAFRARKVLGTFEKHTPAEVFHTTTVRMRTSDGPEKKYKKKKKILKILKKKII